MTITNKTNRTEYDGDGADSGPFVTVWPFFDEEDVIVHLHDDTLGTSVQQVLDTDYSVAGGDGVDGSITFLIAPPPAGQTIIIFRLHDQEQEIDLTTGDSLPAETVEEGFDRNTLKALDAWLEAKNRSIRAPDGDPDVSFVLPNAVDRASASLGFDASGNVSITAAVVGTVTPSPFWAGVLLVADADTSRNAANLNAAPLTMTTLGDILYRDASGYQRLPVGSNDEYLKLAAGIPSWAPIASSDIGSVAVPQGYRWGMTLSPDSGGGDTANDVNVLPGTVRDAGDTAGIVLAAEITKQLDTGSAWADGDDAAGRAAGVAHAQSTWYHVFVLAGADGTTLVDVGFDTSPVAANLLVDAAVTTFFGGTPIWRRIGSVLTDAQGPPAQNYQWTQAGPHFIFHDLGYLDVDVVNQDYQPSALLTVTSPLGVKCKFHFNITHFNNSTTTVSIYDPAMPDINTSTTAWPLFQGREYPTNTSPQNRWVMTDTSSQVRASGTNGTVTDIRIAALGWEDFIED